MLKMISFLQKKMAMLVMVLLLTSVSLFAQFDSLKMEVGTILTGASKDYQPHYTTTNRWGTVSDRRFDPAFFLSLRNKHTLISGEPKVMDTGYMNRDLVIEYGGAAYVSDQFDNLMAQQLYASLQYKKWMFNAGRFQELVGGMDPDLSTGSLGISGNALPIPKVGFSVRDWVDVPFINGWLKFKGSFYHGWMGGNRYQNASFLHEKTFYMQLDLGKLKLYGGIQHFGEWGGKRGNTTLDRDWDGFWNVLLVREAGDGGGLPSNIRPGRAGDQRGLLEFGADWENDRIKLHAYNQTPFETGIGIDIRNIDRLAGISLERKGHERGLKRILAEYIYTKQSEGYGREIHSYYNNGVYKTGWEYKQRVVGTPLFTNRTRANKYYESIVPWNWDAPDNTIRPNDNIVNNRVVGLSLGALYDWAPALQTKTMVTFTRNYGSLETNDFRPSRDQAYLLQEFRYLPTTSRWNFTLAVAADFGDMTDNFGGMLRAGYRIF